MKALPLSKGNFFSPSLVSFYYLIFGSLSKAGKEAKQEKVRHLTLWRSAQSKGPQQMPTPVPTKGIPEALEADCWHSTQPEPKKI